jgi:RNA polymerase sigma-70 factor (ECF subfamily)
VVELNRAVAVAMRDGPAAGLALLDAILERGELAEYHLAHAARGEFLRQLGDFDGAKSALERARELTSQTTEREFLAGKLRELKP